MADALLRAPRREELPALAERLALGGLLEVACPLDPSSDARVAEVGGRLVGTCWVRLVSGVTVFSADGTEAYVEGRVDADHRGRGVGAALLGWTLDRARAAGARSVFTDTDSPAGVALLTAEGFRPDRLVEVMVLEDPAGVGPPAWPAGARLERRGRGEALVDAVVAACDGAFADLEGYRGATRPVVARVLADESSDPSLCLLARRGGEVVGLCYCRLERSGDALGGWIEDLGVAPAARGIGLGRALLRQGVAELAARGAGSVLLGVDARNAVAKGLYLATGFKRTSELIRYRLRLDRAPRRPRDA
jgi:mycothiol synthase